MKEHASEVILVEDDEALRIGVTQALELEGFAVTSFGDAVSALEGMAEDFPGVVVSDVRLPGMDGISMFEALRERDTNMQVIFTTAHGDVDMAVAAMKNGAADFFTKPYSISRLAHSIRRAQELRTLALENRALRSELESRSQSGMFGRSPAAQRLATITQEVAKTDTDLLLLGDPGTGKSHLARQIHDLSQRAKRPFVVVDPGILANEEADLLLYGRDPSAALSRSGLIERANGGTLVLEEIEQFSERSQARLLSLVDNRTFYALGAERPRTVDIRIIATSVQREVNAPANPGALRNRLGGVTVALPTLAERQQDIPALFREFLRQYENELDREAPELSEVELRHLLTHDWSGNLRELRMYAQNFVLGLTKVVGKSVPDNHHPTLRELLANYEKSLLEDALSKAGGNVSQIQRNLDLPRKTLYDKLARYNLRPADFRSIR